MAGILRVNVDVERCRAWRRESGLVSTRKRTQAGRLVLLDAGVYAVDCGGTTHLDDGPVIGINAVQLSALRFHSNYSIDGLHLAMRVCSGVHTQAPAGNRPKRNRLRGVICQPKSLP